MTSEFTPDRITRLHPNEIFVFGSNKNGDHAAGAASMAATHFAAAPCVGEGLTGQAYAFPTLDRKMKPLDKFDLDEAAFNFKMTTYRLPALTFYLTKVGCGIAGFTEDYMKQFFTGLPKNVIKPEGW